MGFLTLGFLGFIDALYLTVNHYLGTAPNCIIGGNCEQVLASAYASVAGVPVSLLGALYYLVIFILAILYFDSRKVFFLSVAALMTPAGFLASLVFSYIQFFVLRAFCPYCVLSAVISTLLFVLGILHFRQKGFVFQEIQNILG